MTKYYSDYLTVSGDFDPCMDANRINSSPDKWLAFYPHQTFVKLLETVLEQMSGGRQAIVLAGAYGTGKSHAALVLQKLFMDDSARVDKWLGKHRERIPETLVNKLKNMRQQRTLAVFTSGCDNIDQPVHLLVRMEKAVQEALRALPGSQIPVHGNAERVLQRVKEEGENFFTTRNRISGELCHLTPDISTYAALEQAISSPERQSGLFSDVMRVLGARSIFLDVTSANFLAWIKEVADVNKFQKVLFIWDEFSEYLENNRSRLSTFQELAEAAQEGRFYLLPVIHNRLDSFLGTGAENAKKVLNRFAQCQLEMPTHTAIELAGQALEARQDDWKIERIPLWKTVQPLVENYMSRKDADCKESPGSFEHVLPLHPMAAIMLKYLSVLIGANQRSLFSFLRNQKGDSEFQSFLQEGSPELSGKQFLTVDYLWSYFVERNDLGNSDRVMNISIEFKTKSQNLSDQEQRVFKAALLYSLLEQEQGSEGGELVSATQENIKRCFEGDGGVVGVEDLLKSLETKHCLTLYPDGRYGMFTSSNISTQDLEQKKQQLYSQFQQLLLEPHIHKPLETEVTRRCKDKARLKVRVASPENALKDSQQEKKLFGSEDCRVLVQFVLAPNEEGQRRVFDRIAGLTGNMPGYRVLYVTVPGLNFSTRDVKNWDKFVEAAARQKLANNDKATTEHCRKNMEEMAKKWALELHRKDQVLSVHYLSPDNSKETVVEDCTWETFQNVVSNYIRRCFKHYVDDYSGYNDTAMKESGSCKSWALHGFDLQQKGVYTTVSRAFREKGISPNVSWFQDNPHHPLAEVRAFCDQMLKKKLASVQNGGLHLSELFLQLRRPPFGLLPVPFSAYVLGFATSHWLSEETGQLQVTDGKQSIPLDGKTLDELISEAVKNNGEALKKERWLCQLSPEEKCFINEAPVMFHLGASTENSTLKTTLQNISSKLQREAERIPLQLLCTGSRSDVEIIIEKLVKALGTSGKGNQQELAENIRECGRRLKDDASLALRVAAAVRPERLMTRFVEYVNDQGQELLSLAERIGTADVYADLRANFVEQASWLWTHEDVDREISLQSKRYRVVEQLQQVFGNHQYLRCQEGLGQLRKLLEGGRISLDSLCHEFPALQQLRDCLACADESRLEELARHLSEQGGLLRELFFDPAQTRSLALLRQWFPQQLSGMSDDVLRQCYEELPRMGPYDDALFRKQFIQTIVEAQKSSAAGRLAKLWREKTGTDTPHAWVEANGMPVNVLFDMPALAHEIIPVLKNPQIFQVDNIEKSYVTLDGARLLPRSKWHQHFMSLYIPESVQEMNIEPPVILDYLRQNLHANPEQWLEDHAELQKTVSRFMREKYATTVKRTVMEKARRLSDAEAKQMLLQLLDSIPEAGMDFLNNQP